MTASRREVIRATPIIWVGLSGCLFGGPGGSTDITIYNESGNSIIGDISIETTDTRDQLLDETFSLSVDESREYDEVVSDEEVEVYVGLKNGSENTFQWADGETDSSALEIFIKADSIEAKSSTA